MKTYPGTTVPADRDPDDSQALIDLVHILYDQRREDEALEGLDIAPWPLRWRWLGIFVRARLRKDGTVANIEQLFRTFGEPIRECLAVMVRGCARNSRSVCSATRLNSSGCAAWHEKARRSCCHALECNARRCAI